MSVYVIVYVCLGQMACDKPSIVNQFYFSEQQCQAAADAITRHKEPPLPSGVQLHCVDYDNYGEWSFKP